ncbi:MAG: glycine dehydrogenase (aminomethyl-transferring) [Chloroflexi bacterium RBG_16_54_18]|nr:MAG: glycine dehydrogenase (aminomethyl-transferring) [Chloroflexi bacterium RBG_16_54_18]
MYIPHTKEDREAMLQTVGVKRIEDLFQVVPAAHRFPELKLPSALTEMEVMSEMKDIAAANESVQDLVCFLGAGAYNHYIPPVVDAILRRGEFYTAYTPYQPEISQGTLQAIFDYQSLVTALTGMEVSNASHYDGATAVAEAVSMAYANFRGKRNKVVLSSGLHPHYRETIRTYNQGTSIVITGDLGKVGPDAGTGSLLPLIDQDTALVIVQYPDFFGRITDFSSLAEAVHVAGALLAVAVNPLSLGLLKPPGDFGADIVTAEGQPLGIPLSYGGPYLGIFATRKDYARKMAGRLVGETVDNRGQRAYVLTLTAREQHIRREKATSNICTNQALIALAATVYMSLLGKQGLKEVAELCYHKAHYAANKISGIPGFSLWSKEPFFNEFVVRCPSPVSEINEYLLDEGILGGYDLGQDYPELENHMLLALTEMNSKADIDFLVDLLTEQETLEESDD